MEHLPSCSEENEDTMESSVAISEEERESGGIKLPEWSKYEKISRSDQKLEVEFIVKELEELENWVKLFEELNGIHFTIMTTSSSGTLYALRTLYRCHHNTGGRSIYSDRKRQTKNTQCPVTLTVKAKLPYPGEEEYVCSVTLIGIQP